jgi:hypothetical protein
VAPGDAGVAKDLAFHGDELPLVSLRAQGEFEDAVGVVDAHLAVGDRVRDRPLASASAAQPRVLAIHFELEVNPVTSSYLDHELDLWIEPDGTITASEG